MEVKNLWELVLPRLQRHIQEKTITSKIVADFCKVKTQTVRSWVVGRHPAEGDKLIRLWQLMTLWESSPEMSQLSQLNRIMVQLYAFDVISLDDVKLYSGISSAHSANTYAFLRGQDAMHPETRVPDLEMMYGDVLSEKKRELKSLYRVPVNADLPKPVQAPNLESAEAEEPSQTEDTQPVSVPAADNPLSNMDPILMLATLLGAAAPIAKTLNSDATSAKERSVFRELITSEVLFELSNTISALCSERARGMAIK